MNRLKSWYLEPLTGYVDAMDSALAAGDDDSVVSLRRMAHRLAGSAGSYGYPALGDLAQSVERALPAQLETAARALLEGLVQVVATAARRTILIVDDDPATQTMVMEALSGPNRYVRAVSNALDGLDYLNQQPVDLVVLDLDLPDIDGRTFLARLRGQAGGGEVPVIVVSRYAAAHVQTECWALGVAGYHNKPIDRATFRSQVSGVIANEHRAAQAASEDALTSALRRKGSGPEPCRGIRRRQCAAACQDSIDRGRLCSGPFRHAAARARAHEGALGAVR